MGRAFKRGGRSSPHQLAGALGNDQIGTKLLARAKMNVCSWRELPDDASSFEVVK